MKKVLFISYNCNVHLSMPICIFSPISKKVVIFILDNVNYNDLVATAKNILNAYWKTGRGP